MTKWRNRHSLDIEQINRAAQSRWLRPAEICAILQNYKKFHCAPEPENRPPSGSLFLFNREQQRYFRNDRYNWKKKPNGNAVSEGHEKLKVKGNQVLDAYYAHCENRTFHRRSYRLLEVEASHMVLVHYREVKVVDDGVPSNSEEIVDLNDDPMNIDAPLTWLQNQPPLDFLLS